jgi:hypothetical protein
MTTAADLFDLIYAALLPDVTQQDSPVPTDAGARIDRPGVVPAQGGQYPRVSMRLIGETKQSQGHASIGFTTSVTIRVVGEASAPVSLADVHVSTIEAQLWRLKRQIEVAIIGSYPLAGLVQQLATVQSQLSFDAQATMLAGVQSDFTFELYEDASDFAPIGSAPLTSLDAHLPGNGPGFLAPLPQ